MKVTKTIDIEFPWKLENDGHGWTTIHKEPDGTYRYVNKFSDHTVCEERIIPEAEVQTLVDSCYQIVRYEP